MLPAKRPNHAINNHPHSKQNESAVSDVDKENLQQDRIAPNEKIQHPSLNSNPFGTLMLQNEQSKPCHTIKSKRGREQHCKFGEDDFPTKETQQFDTDSYKEEVEKLKHVECAFLRRDNLDACGSISSYYDNLGCGSNLDESSELLNDSQTHSEPNRDNTLFRSSESLSYNENIVANAEHHHEESTLGVSALRESTLEDAQSQSQFQFAYDIKQQIRNHYDTPTKHNESPFPSSSYLPMPNHGSLDFIGIQGVDESSIVSNAPIEQTNALLIGCTGDDFATDLYRHEQVRSLHLILSHGIILQ